jgi:hypothetical protein
MSIQTKSVSELVKKGATIGANATIVCGHDIGEFKKHPNNKTRKNSL